MWIYKEKIIKDINDFPEGCFGFVYVLTNLENNKKYIGKKNLYSKQNKKLGKKELENIKEERKKNKTRGKLPTKKLVVKESSWKNYRGTNSNKQLDELHKLPEDKIKKEIISFAFNSKQLTYRETQNQFENKVLENPELYYNSNILGKFFIKDVMV
jgi:hypothetical protein